MTDRQIINEINERFDKSIDLSIIDLKSQGRETVTAFEVLRNSIDFLGKL